MATKRLLLQGATAFLYMGPLLAGLAGFGWAMLPPFISVFLLWLMMVRPEAWPRTNREWLRVESWLTALTHVLTQTLLVAILFGVGRGIGGVLGQLPMFDPLLPVAVSFVAIPISRMVWTGESELLFGRTIDELIYPHRRAPQPPLLLPGPTVPPDEVIIPLLDIPEDAPLSVVRPLLEEVLDDPEAWARLGALGDALEDEPTRHATLRVALMRWATEPETLAANAAPAVMRVAFGVAGSDLKLLKILLPRAAAVARMMPERQSQFPDRADLEAIGRLNLSPQLAADHASLMAALGLRPPADMGRWLEPSMGGRPRIQPS